MSTPKGADPHRPEFGSDLWWHVDKPRGEAIPLVVRDAIDAVTRWERRIEVIRVVVLPDAEPAQLKMRVDWRLKGRDEVQATEVDLVSA